MQDKFGTPILTGDYVAYAAREGRSVRLKIEVGRVTANREDSVSVRVLGRGAAVRVGKADNLLVLDARTLTPGQRKQLGETTDDDVPVSEPAAS